MISELREPFANRFSGVSRCFQVWLNNTWSSDWKWWSCQSHGAAGSTSPFSPVPVAGMRDITAIHWDRNMTHREMWHKNWHKVKVVHVWVAVWSQSCQFKSVMVLGLTQCLCLWVFIMISPCFPDVSVCLCVLFRCLLWVSMCWILLYSCLPLFVSSSHLLVSVWVLFWWSLVLVLWV